MQSTRKPSIKKAIIEGDLETLISLKLTKKDRFYLNRHNFLYKAIVKQHVSVVKHLLELPVYCKSWSYLYLSFENRMPFEVFSSILDLKYNNQNIYIPSSLDLYSIVTCPKVANLVKPVVASMKLTPQELTETLCEMIMYPHFPPIIANIQQFLEIPELDLSFIDKRGKTPMQIVEERAKVYNSTYHNIIKTMILYRQELVRTKYIQ
jgi:hypothetical protein